MSESPTDTSSPYTMIAVAWGLWSGLGVLLGLFVGLFFGGMGGLMTVLPDSNTGEPAPWWLGLFFGGFGVGIGFFLAIVSLVGFVIAVALGRGHRWAIFGVCVLAFLHMSQFPVGTALAAITFWTVFSDPKGPFSRGKAT